MKKSVIAVAATLIWWCSTILATSSSSSSSSSKKSPKAVENWVETLSHKQEKLTKLHFYFHRLGGAAPSAAIVAEANMTIPNPTTFGLTVIKDDPLTVGPELSSTLIGRAQGMSATASLNDVVLAEYFTFSFNDGSSLAVLGSNAMLHEYRELPTVGGTGVFRVARGVVTYQTLFFNATTREAAVEAYAFISHF